MSDGPAKRRRIAGENRPGENPAAPASRKVVRKPVARPGGAPPRRPDEPVEPVGDESTVDEAVVEAPVPDETVADEPAAGEPAVETPAADEGDADGTEVLDATGTDAEAAPATRRPPRVAGLRGRRPAADDTDGTDADDADGAVAIAAVDADEPAAARAPRSRRTTLVTALAVAAIAFGLVGGVLGVLDWRGSQGVSTAHADAAETAAASAETIFTYQYDQLEQYLEDSQDVMTASFAQEFETISPALQDLAPQREIQVQATTRDAAALPCGDDCDTDRARVLLFVDQARIADGAERPTVFGNRVEMTMVERDGRWLVDDIKAL